MKVNFAQYKHNPMFTNRFEQAVWESNVNWAGGY